MMQSKHYIAIPPGATIKEQLEDRGMTQKEFAERMGLSEKHTSKLINGEVQLTQDVALKLASVLGLPAKFWNNLERTFREQAALVKDELTMEAEKEIAKTLPYADCANLGWLPKTRSITEKVRNLRVYFGVADLTILEKSQTPNIYFRQLSKKATAQRAANMWIQKVKNESLSLQADKINIQGLLSDLEKIREMTREDVSQFYPELSQILAINGVKLVFLPSLKNSYIHGASFLFRDAILLGITIRGLDVDKFWFSLFHELAHIVLGHIFEPLLTQEMEEEADRFSRQYLIPENDYRTFIEKNEINRSSITYFANDIGIDKGIVIGRLQYDRHLNFNQLTDMKRKYDTIEIS